MGLESIEQKNLRNNHKSFNDPARYREVVERLHHRRIALQGCFVFGLDEDTPDVFLKTARFAVEAKIDLPRFAIVTPGIRRADDLKGDQTRTASAAGALSAGASYLVVGRPIIGAADPRAAATRGASASPTPRSPTRGHAVAPDRSCPVTGVPSRPAP